MRPAKTNRDDGKKYQHHHSKAAATGGPAISRSATHSRNDSEPGALRKLAPKAWNFSSTLHSVCLGAQALHARRIVIPQEPQEIEVDVVEVDGIPVEPRPQANHNEHTANTPQWQKWAGRARQLPAFWWPVWVLLGIIGVALLLTVGLVVAVIYAVFHLIQRVIRSILG